MDKIFLRALTVECIVGIWELERRVKQTVVIDLEMAADIRGAAATDRIEDTLDYKKVAKRRSAEEIAPFQPEFTIHNIEELKELFA